MEPIEFQLEPSELRFKTHLKYFIIVAENWLAEHKYYYLLCLYV